MVQLLDELQIDRAIFVGTSLGGLVTMVMTAIAPGRIAAAILNDIGPELSQAGLDRIMLLRRQRRAIRKAGARRQRQ